MAWKMGKLTRKQITFDLNIAETEKHHPAHRNLDAYMDIRKFMEKNGFVRTQGSVYESLEPIKTKEIEDILYNMTKELPWITKAMTACSYTSIGIKHNGMEIINPALVKENKSKILSQKKKKDYRSR